MGLTRSRLLGIVLILAGGVAIIAGVALFSVPAALVLAGALVAVVGLSLLIEVRP